MPVEPLTASHFAPAFKKTIGVAHTNYLSDLKSEGAKREMLASEVPLADSRLDLQFGDQDYSPRRLQPGLLAQADG